MPKARTRKWHLSNVGRQWLLPLDESGTFGPPPRLRLAGGLAGLASLGVGVPLVQGGEDDEAPPPLSSVMSL